LERQTEIALGLGRQVLVSDDDDGSLRNEESEFISLLVRKLRELDPLKLGTYSSEKCYRMSLLSAVEKGNIPR
jgi:hypothetical protein